MYNPTSTSRYAAVCSLLENGVNALPITVTQIESIINSKGFSIINYDTNYSKHIEILKDMGVFALAKRVKAFTYTSKDGHIVFISSGLSNNDRRLLLAHELGHIEMGHMSDNCILSYTPMGLIDGGQEDEANAFALEFLAPVCVLDKMRRKNIDDIIGITLLDDRLACAVADEVCKHRIFTSQELELCDMFGCIKRLNVIDKIKSFFKAVTINA